MDNRIELIIKHIHNNLDEKIILKKAAEMTNLSYSYFSELFEKELDVTFSQYLKNIRIEEAKRLLRENSLSIKEISFKTGFRYASSVCKEFKSLLGVLPSTYRKKSRVINGLNLIFQPIRKFANTIVKFSNRNRK